MLRENDPEELTTPQGQKPDTTTTTRPASALTVAPGGDRTADMAAWRCWTWKTRHACGCETAGDCQLLEPLPIHGNQGCRGMFGAGGRWMPCCGRGAA
jgi:hypothetical protein